MFLDMVIFVCAMITVSYILSQTASKNYALLVQDFSHIILSS
jgi:hypothetical protein